MFKDEGMIIEEWVRHHLECGVDHIYLLDNGSTDAYRSELDPYIARGVVTLESDPRRFGRQTLDVKRWNAKTASFDRHPVDRAHTHMHLLNEHFLERIKAEAAWVWVIDIDEYVFSTKRTLAGLVQDAPDTVSEIWAPWRIFGSSGLQMHPPSVREHFTQRMSHPRFVERVQSHGRVRGHGKTCTRVSALRRLGIHQCEVTGGRTLLPDGSTVRGKPELADWFARWTPDPATDLVYCNHYMVMSREHYVKCKMTREGGAGRPNSAKAMATYWARNDANDEPDTLVMQRRRVRVGTAGVA